MNDENKIAEKRSEISGYASVFNVVDSHGDVILKDAFEKAVKLFKKGIKKPKFLWQHDVTSPIGIIDELFEDDYGLFVRGHLLLDIPKAREACSLIKNEAINGFSIGYNVRDGYEKDGKKYLTDINLLEISIVTFPACEQAVISDAQKSDIVRDLKSISEKVKQFLMKGEKYGIRNSKCYFRTR